MRRVSRASGVMCRSAIAIMLGLAVGAPLAVQGQDAGGRAFLQKLQERSARIRTFTASCEVEARAKVVSYDVTFGGGAHMWVKSPDRVRVDVEAMSARGMKGESLPSKMIEAGGKFWQAKIVNEEAPVVFDEVEPIPVGSSDRVPWVPGNDYVRPPFPLSSLVGAVTLVSTAQDSLAGRPAVVLSLRAGRRGGVSGDRIRWWVDAERLCLLREESLDAQGNVVAHYDFEEVRELAPGLFLPTRLVHYAADGKRDFVCRFRETKLDGEVPDSLFVPAAVRE